MKRIVFASALLVFLIIFNCFCLDTITKIKNEATLKLDELYMLTANEDFEKTALECEKFTEYWLSEHHILSLIVRHDLLDQTTFSVSRFVPLAKFEEKGELASEISRCKILLDEIWDCERPLFRNIF
ncbi:MAG: DUF4363 family protein [Oscillospiraceae bacterium]|nr:DUF4363 family protein [Oscillospiraceae bacterium]